MVTVQLSKDEKLILPESLGRSLGLCEGDRVEVRRQDSILPQSRIPKNAFHF
jgi:hypothetical protein